MPEYKLTYFNLKALGEPIRFLLSYGKIDFEDVRIEIEDWPKYKTSMPMGVLPVLTVEGRQLDQSISICRFVAKRVGLGGFNDFEDFEIDCVVDTINDFRFKLQSTLYLKEPAEYEKNLKFHKATTFPFYLSKLEEISKENLGYLALKRRTWADLYFAAIVEYLQYLTGENLLKNNPNLMKIVSDVLDIEEISKWISKRPFTKY